MSIYPNDEQMKSQATLLFNNHINYIKRCEGICSYVVIMGSALKGWKINDIKETIADNIEEGQFHVL
jgi:hypothetical protein